MFRVIILASTVFLSIACIGADPSKNTSAEMWNSGSNSNLMTPVPGAAPDQIKIEEIKPPQVITMEKGNHGGAPTPGIPGPEELKKPFKPGTKPTPGIPDEKTIKKMLSETPVNSNIKQQ